MKKLTYLRFETEYFLLGSFGWFMRKIPLNWGLRLGELLGDFTYRVLGIRRKVVLDNLKYAFYGEKRWPEILEIACNVYKHFGKMLVEFARFPITSPDILKKKVSFENLGYVEEAVKMGRGVLLLSGHLGNWELMGGAIATTLGNRINVLVAPQKNRLVDRLINNYRGKIGVNSIYVGASVKETIKALKRGELVGILTDQDAGRGGLFVDFLGRPASVPRGPATIAIKLKVPVLMVLTVRDPEGYHRVVFEKVADIDSFPESDDGIRSLTEEYTHILERYVRTWPGQWFWLHRKWKTKPIKD